jgi:hypothetical protein
MGCRPWSLRPDPGQVDAPLRNDGSRWNGRPIGSGRPPLVDQFLDADHVPGIGVEDRVDVSRRPDHTVTDQRDAADQDVSDSSLVEAFENAAEAGHLTVAAISSA